MEPRRTVRPGASGSAAQPTDRSRRRRRLAVGAGVTVALLGVGGAATAATPDSLRSDIAVTLTGPPVGSTLTFGDTVEFTMTVRNLGPDTATLVTASNTLPAELRFVSVGSTTGCRGDAAGVRCSWASLARGASRSVSFKALVAPNLAPRTAAAAEAAAAAAADGYAFETRATASASQTDPDRSNNTARRGYFAAERPDPTISLDDVSVVEGNTGSTDAKVTIRLSDVAGKPYTVWVQTMFGTAGADDYQPLKTPVSFDYGETSKTVTVKVVGDTVDEGDEAFTLDVIDADGLAGDDSSTITIVDDDRLPAVSVGDRSVDEGNRRTSRQVDVPVTLSRASTRPVTVTLAIADGTATRADSDYRATTPVTVRFAAGATTASVRITVLGDRQVEPDETVKVTVTSVSSGATIGDGEGVLTIRNDDVAVPAA